VNFLLFAIHVAIHVGIFGHDITDHGDDIVAAGHEVELLLFAIHETELLFARHIQYSELVFLSAGYEVELPAICWSWW
jgi:hypothetical protein